MTLYNKSITKDRDQSVIKYCYIGILGAVIMHWLSNKASTRSISHKSLHDHHYEVGPNNAVRSNNIYLYHVCHGGPAQN